MSIEPKSCVLFDLDGTLMDTAPDFIATLRILRARYHLPELDSTLVRNTVSDGSRALTRICFHFEEQSPEFEQKRLELLDIYASIVGTEVKFFPEIKAALEAIEQRNIPWGIVTNKPRLYTELLLERTGLATNCKVLVCADDLKHAKPNPEGILYACEQLNCSPSHSIYVGDHERDIEAGRAAGCKTVAVTFGYIEDPDEIENWNPDIVMSKAEDLVQGLN